MERGRGRRGRSRKNPRLTTNAEHYDMNGAGKPHPAPAVPHQSSTCLPHPANSSDEDEDAQFSWFNAAMIWLALRQEDQEEAGKMKQAMEESLRHIQILREKAAATDPPLTNLSEDRLRRRFKGSAVLRHLDTVMPARVLFSDADHLRSLVSPLGVSDVKFKLVELLRLEEQCSKWYPAEGTGQYWEKFGKRVAEQLSVTRGSCSQVLRVVLILAGVGV
eukprot:gene10335-10492_t